MRADVWTALLVGIAGVLAGLAAIPATSFRMYVLIAASGLVMLALLIAAAPRRSPEPTFAITTPKPDEGIRASGAVVDGTIYDIGEDTLWVFEEGWILGRRVWLFGGEALVNGNTWRFDYEPRVGPTEKALRTLSVVRADRNCERQLRTIQPDRQGRRVVYDPIPGGCTVLGRVSIVIAAQQ